MVHHAITEGVNHPNLLNGLVAKRAEIAGQIEANQQQLRKLIVDLDAIEATIRVFDPDIDMMAIHPRPVPPRHAAFKGEVTRIVFKALREAKHPVTSRDIAKTLMRERGLNVDDKDVVVMMTKRVGACLKTQKNKGYVRSVDIEGSTLLGWVMVRKAER